MKRQSSTDRLEPVLWDSARRGAAEAPDAGWRAGVMRAVRQAGPLAAGGRVVRDADFQAWAWVTAAAACLALLLTGLSAFGPTAELSLDLSFLTDYIGFTGVAQLWEVL